MKTFFLFSFILFFVSCSNTDESNENKLLNNAENKALAISYNDLILKITYKSSIDTNEEIQLVRDRFFSYCNEPTYYLCNRSYSIRLFTAGIVDDNDIHTEYWIVTDCDNILQPACPDVIIDVKDDEDVEDAKDVDL